MCFGTRPGLFGGHAEKRVKKMLSVDLDLQPTSQLTTPAQQEHTSSFVTTFLGPPRSNQRVSCLHGPLSLIAVIPGWAES